MSKFQRGLVVAVATTAGSMVTTGAVASGYAVREQSPVAQGTSQAGAAARGDDPSFMFFNPAAIGWSTGIVVSTGVSGIIPSSSNTSGSGTRAAIFGGSPISGGLGGSAGYAAALGNFAVSARLSEQWAIGVTGNTPWGLTTKYENDYVGRYHALTSTLRSFNLSPSIAWRPLPNLVVAAGLQIQGLQARLSSAVDYGAAGATNPLLARAGFAPGAFDGRATTRGSSTDVGWTVGVQWEPITGTRVGLGFRSAIFSRLQGGAQFDGVPALLSTSVNFANTPITAKVATPEVLTFGVSHRIGERWTALAGAEWTNWSRFRELRIDFANGRAPSVTDERWRNTAFVSLGGEYRMTDTVTLRAGVAWDQSPVPAATRTPRIPDSNRYWLSAGVTWQVRPNIALTAAYTHVFADTGTLGLVDGGPTSTNFLRGNLVSNNSANVNIVAVGARFSF